MLKPALLDGLFFCDRGADAGARDRWGSNALADAIRHGHAAIAKLLRARGADLDVCMPDRLKVLSFIHSPPPHTYPHPTQGSPTAFLC